jgi:type IV pilus assembly protein PilM
MLSIDIGSKKVCIIEGNYNNGNVIVTACGEIEYTSEVTVNGMITDRSNLAFLINEIIITKHMKSKQAVISINSSDIVLREFKLPNIKLPSLQLLVKNEMNNILGNDSEFIVDFVVTGETSEKLLTVFAYAVPSDMVDGYYKLLKESKLSAVSLDIHANSISKLLSNTLINGTDTSDGNFIVADIGFSKITFHGFIGGACRFNRTEISPVQEFLQNIDAYSNEADREQLDLTPDIEQKITVLSDTYKYILPRVVDEIQRYMQYIMINSPSKSVLKIYICGGVASIKGADIALSNILKIPVHTLINVGRLTLPENCSLAKVCNAAGALIRL